MLTMKKLRFLLPANSYQLCDCESHFCELKTALLHIAKEQFLMPSPQMRTN